MAYGHQMPPEFQRLWDAIQKRLGSDYRVRDISLHRDLASYAMTVRVALDSIRGMSGEIEVMVQENVVADEKWAADIAERLARQMGVPDPTPPELPEPADKLTDHIIGFRLWRIANGELESLFQHKPREWKRGAWVAADCHGGFHPAPAPHCHCGWNAFHEPTGAINQYAQLAKEDPAVVLGALQAKGRVELHHEGFRAQWARPIALRGAQVAGIASVERSEELVEFALEFGSPVPSKLRPERGLYDASMNYGGSASGSYLSHRVANSSMHYAIETAMPYYPAASSIPWRV